MLHLIKVNSNNPADIYFFKSINRNTRKRCEVCLKLTIKTPERERINYFLMIREKTNVPKTPRPTAVAKVLGFHEVFFLCFLSNQKNISKKE